MKAEYVKYGFKIGEQFNVEIEKPDKDGTFLVKVKNVSENPLIYTGTFRKTKDSFVQNLEIESILDKLPEGDYRIMLQGMGEPND